MSLLADSLVDWGALAQVAYISVIAGVAIAAILGLAIVSELRAQEGGGAAISLRAVTVVCVAVVAAAVVVGIYYMTQKS
jgi:thiosulfate reductase cytochrome b subunit